MYYFSQSSLDRLWTCDKRLKKLFKEVIRTFDCTIVCGFRGKEAQNRAFESGDSEVKWSKSKHNHMENKMPRSHAADVAPWIDEQISWNLDNCRYFAGYVMAKADSLGIPIRWGGDWNSNKNTTDQKFNDLVHFELII